MKRILLIGGQQSEMQVTEALGGLYRVVRASEKNEVSAAIAGEKIDLILLDISLANINGFDLLTQLKSVQKTQDIPVVIMTEKSSVNDKVRGLSLGADDYIVIPFEPHEFKARIDSRIRFRDTREPFGKRIKKGRVELDSNMGRCFYWDESGQKMEINLTPHEFRLLSLFVQSNGTILSRSELMKNVWGESTFVLPRTVDRHISSLRAKIDPRCGHLDAVHGVGYRFELNA